MTSSLLSHLGVDVSPNELLSGTRRGLSVPNDGKMMEQYGKMMNKFRLRNYCKDSETTSQKLGIYTIQKLEIHGSETRNARFRNNVSET